MFFRIKNASFEYEQNKLILDNISFSLNEGEILAIMGSNGIGKTTLIKCIMGILELKMGQVYINDKKGKESLLDIAYVPQGHKSTFSYSVMEMVLFGRAKHMSIFSLPQEKDYEIATEALKDMGIYHLKDKSCNSLSGGQLQMVMVARAIAAKPKLLILDEPESHLDFYNQVLILDTIYSLARKRRITCILNTHYPNHAIKLADKLLLLDKGDYKIGKPLDILNSENVEKFFNVKSTIANVNVENKWMNIFVVIDKM
ncbi:MAG: ABC transporter ATP-binding protein [Peptoniphilaceae bacterium]